MQGEKGERWMQLCKQAAVEQDSKKLVELIGEINRLLQEKEQRLLELRATSARSGGAGQRHLGRRSSQKFAG